MDLFCILPNLHYLCKIIIVSLYDRNAFLYVISIILKLMKLTKNNYLKFFFILIAVLAIVRWVFPGVASSKTEANIKNTTVNADSTAYALSDSVGKSSSEVIDNDIVAVNDSGVGTKTSRFFNQDGEIAKHRIFSVPNFGQTFPDQQDIQLEAANKLGVKPVRDRADAAKHKGRLVSVASNPYFSLDNLHSSIPYLVPRASILLQDIGRSFFDSLQIKGIPLHKIIITSVMRSEDDVTKLRSHNGNATRNSCHMYGTTFDVSYNRYLTVEAPGEIRRKVRNDTLKWVLSEVLRDMRQNNRCFIKYEVNQGCFHITVK